MLCFDKLRQQFYKGCQVVSGLADPSPPNNQRCRCLRLRPLTKYWLALIALSLVSVSVYVQLTDGFHSLQLLLWKTVGDTVAMKFLRDNIGQRGFLLNNPYCPIPDLNPHSHISALNVGHARKISCSGLPALTMVEGNSLRIIWSSVYKVFGDNFHRCEYWPFTRAPGQFVDDAIRYLPEIYTFTTDQVIPNAFDYIKVTCYDSLNLTKTTEYHSLIHSKAAEQASPNHDKAQREEARAARDRYNVYLLGVDSLSRLNMIRLMPKTRHFLLDQLQALELPGYSKVADNTFPNMVPFLTGYFPRELNWNESFSFYYLFENFPFIWKNFSREGYRTMYSEDDPSISIFNYNKAGFKVPPADFYNRPQVLAMYQDRFLWNNQHCVGNTLETSLLLNQISHFAHVHQDRPHFVFTFITRLTHDSARLLATADDAYFNFFRTFHAQGHLERSVLIFFSDHGHRFGLLRNTYYGKYEERMPMFFIVLPPSFRQKYPQMIKNLQNNANRLTTPFDVHATLLDILYLEDEHTGPQTKGRSISLLREIPQNRSCHSAGVEPHWCLCWQRRPLSPNSSFAMEIGQGVVRLVNQQLQQSGGVCALLSLQSVSELVQMKASEELLLYHHKEDDKLHGLRSEAAILYQVTLTTRPGQARLEATVTFESTHGTMSLAGEISRTNRYGSQSACVNSSSLKKFCYCIH